MIYRHHAPLTVILTILLAGCGDDHKSGTHDTHVNSTTSGSTGDTAAVTTSATTGGTTGATTGATTAPVVPPAAPTDLAASLLEGGVHLTWKDASDNEDNFILENKADGDADFAVVLELPFDSVTYHDIDVVAATNYTYRVKAVNAGGEGLSNEVTIMVP